jgi:hypothetical protein
MAYHSGISQFCWFIVDVDGHTQNCAQQGRLKNGLKKQHMLPDTFSIRRHYPDLVQGYDLSRYI